MIKIPINSRQRTGSFSEFGSAKRFASSPPSPPIPTNTTAGTTNDKQLMSISASFKFFDLNDDGVIDRNELLNYFKSDDVVAGIIDRLDKNKDGVISYSEFYSEVSKIKDGDATLQKYLEKFPLTTPAITTHTAVPKQLHVQKNDINITWSEQVKEDVVDLVLKAGPFVDWLHEVDQIDNPDPTKPELAIDKLHIQHVDMFGPKVGFIKFEVVARTWNEKMQQIAVVPGVVFMRGGSVGILCILIEVETNIEYALITLQPRIPAGYANFPEIPAGMVHSLLFPPYAYLPSLPFPSFLT
jgi:hypothetical protein